MRNLYLLFSLLILTSFTTEARHRFEFLEGRFINPYYGEQVKVKSIRGGIKVKGLPGTRGYKRYYYNRGRFLRPEYGRGVIEVIGPHRMILKRSRRSQGIHFVRKPRKGHQCNMSCCSSRWDSVNRYDRYDRNRGGYDGYYDYNRGRNDRYDYDDRNDRRNQYNRNNRSRDFSLDLSSYLGEWYSNELRKLVIIERSDQGGLKARVSGGKKWTEYQSDGQRWIDQRGNTYHLDSSDILIWTSRNGKEVRRLFRS